MNKQKFVRYLRQLWERRNTDFDNLWTGADHKLKEGHTCHFHKRDCGVVFTGTVMYSNSKSAYMVISNGGRAAYTTYLKDVYPVDKPVHWTEYYGELLKGIEDEMRTKTCGKCKYFFLNSEGHCRCNDGSENAHNDACTFFEPKVITNGDVIRQGGNRALAEFHGKLACDVCAYRYDHRCIAPQGKPLTCIDGIEAWLSAPAESEEKGEG